MSRPFTYVKKHEVFSAITHGVGIGFGIVGLAILVAFSAVTGDVWKIVASSIFGVSMIVLYSASTLYHALSHTYLRKAMNMFDHISIYYLIAGSYTPFVLVSLRGVWGWTIFGIVWGCAIVGTVLKAIYGDKFRKISTTLYLVMGWVIVIAAGELADKIDTGGIILLVAGGLSYTFGVIFYKWRSLPFNHGIWHLFVLAGTVCHFFAILLYVIIP